MIDEAVYEMYKRGARELIGGTPCVVCNRRAKFHILVTRADGEMAEVIVCDHHTRAWLSKLGAKLPE